MPRFAATTFGLLALALPSAALSPGQPEANAEKYLPVSLVRLIADPAAYQNKPVVASGVFSRDAVADRLYLAKEHADYRIVENSVAISFDESYSTMIDVQLLVGLHVVVCGTFEVDACLPGGNPCGVIADVTAIGVHETSDVSFVRSQANSDGN